MATGYTECIMTGEVTELRDFIARSFNNNDEFPVIVKFTDGKWRYKRRLASIDYWASQLAKEKERLAWLENAAEDQLAEAANKEWLRACEYVRERTESESDKIAIRARYDAMIAKVKEWQKDLPHERLLAFSRGLLSQLEQSVKFDCGTKTADPEQPVLQSPSDYKNEAISTCKRMIHHYESTIAERVKEVDDFNSTHNALCRYLNDTKDGDFSFPVGAVSE